MSPNVTDIQLFSVLCIRLITIYLLNVQHVVTQRPRFYITRGHYDLIMPGGHYALITSGGHYGLIMPGGHIKVDILRILIFTK